MKFFPDRKQWLIIRYEDLIDKPTEVRKKLFSFLEIPDRANIDFTQKVYSNKHGYPCISKDKRKQLNDYFRESNQQLESFLGMSCNWD